MGSPSPTMPALVWTLRNNQRGFTRNVSSFVIFRLSLGEMGALADARCCAAASTPANAARPALANALRMMERRSMGGIGTPLVAEQGECGDAKVRITASSLLGN